MKLFKGTFNISGQNCVLYTHANSESQAYRFFIHQMSQMYNVNKRRLLSLFDGSKDNYRIEEG